MSRRYEFLSGGAEVVVPADADDADLYGFEDHEPGTAYLVLGNPWATAAVLAGDYHSIRGELLHYLDVLDAALKPKED